MTEHKEDNVEVSDNQEEAKKAKLNKASEEDVNALHELIRGQNDMFDKTYDFKETGQSFRIKVKFPSFLQKGSINALREEMLSGTGKYQPEGIIIIYQAMAVLEICGKDVPPYFDKNATPREDILYRIGVDLDVWLNSFR